MSAAPVICLGQQPCGIFPKRFLQAKFATARRLQREIGGRIVFFFHDSDHDPRETQTVLRHHTTGESLTVNFTFENKLQRKYSPLYLKRIPAGWRENLARQLPAFAPTCWVEAFRDVRAANVADFCLEMYRRMGLLEGMEIVRSSDPAVRRAAPEVEEFYVDVPHQGEIVRARFHDGRLQLHPGGDAVIDLPPTTFGKEQINPTRDSRLRWMQSVVRCTHYVTGAGEQAYLRTEDAPEIIYVTRDIIERSHEAFTDAPA